MERDSYLNGENAEEQEISTHTLTWSVTGLQEGLFTFNAISTHTLTWSVTPARPWFTAANEISTHTLTWSVTQEVERSGGKV